MKSITAYIVLAALVFSLGAPAMMAQDEQQSQSEQVVLLPSLSSPDAIARQLGGDAKIALVNAVSVYLSQPMYIAPSNRHNAVIFLTAVGAGALVGAIIDGDGGAGKGVLIGAAVGAGYLIAVNF